MYGLVTFGEFGLVTLRENVLGIFLLSRAGGYQLVHGPGSKPPAIYTVLAYDDVLAMHPEPDPCGSRCF